MLAIEHIQDRGAAWSKDRYTIPQTEVTSVTIRAVHKHDAVLIQEMHERLSKNSIYYRYLGPNIPTLDNFRCLCSSNGMAGTALVMTVEGPQEKVIALAYYRIDPNNPLKAEPAVIVEDSFQGRGFGKRIMLALCRDAIKKGVEIFYTFIDPANYRVEGLIKGSGLHFESKYRDGLQEFRVWLKPSA